MKTHLTAKLSLGALLLAGSLALSHAAGDTWTGSTDGTWATAANWLSNPAVAPGTGDTATFNGLGNGNTTIDLGIGVTISNILFDTGSVAAYTIGSGGASNQTLTLGQVDGGITVNSTVANSQLFNANLALPVTGFYNFYNDSANMLTLAGGISASSAGSKVLTVDGTGNTTMSGLISSGSGSVGLQKTNSGTLTLAGGATFAATTVNAYLPGTVNVPVVLRQGRTRVAGGAYTVTGEFVLGGVIADGGPGNNANLTMDGGTLNVSSWFSVGRGNGIGGVSSDVVLNNGAGITSANVSLGYNAGNTNNLPKGTLTLNHNSALNVNGSFFLAESVGSDMTMTLNDSAGFTNSSTGGNNNRISSSGTAKLILNGGTFQTEQDTVIGYSTAAPASATVVVNGGTLKVATSTKRWLQVSRSGSGSAQLIVSNGAVMLDASTDLRMSILGTSIGTNEVSLRGGNITFYTNNATTEGGTGVVDLQYVGAPSSYNTFNLDGGILTVPQVVSSVSSGTRVFNFNGGTLRAATDNVALMNLGAGNSFAFVRNGGALIDSNGKNVTLAQPLLHSAIPGDAATDGGLTKTGNGTLTLTAVSTYTGPTRVNAGTLALAGGSLSSPSISLSDAAALSVLAPVAAQVAPLTLTVGSASGGVALNFVAVSTAQAPLKPGTLTFNGANTINIVGGNFVAGNSYPLITYTTLAGSGTYSLGPLPSGITGNLSLSGNTIYFNVTGVSNTAWTGAVNGTWDIATTPNWTNAAGGNTYTDGSLVQFDDTGLSTVISNSVPTVLKPSAILVNNSLTNYSFKVNTIIAGTTGITKTGTGSLTNATPNTYTGPTVINQGAVVAGVASVANASGALGNNSAVTLGNDASVVLNLNGFATQIGSLTGGGPGTGNVVLGGGTLTVGGDNSSPGVYAGNISGGGGLTKIGSGTLTLGGTNTFTGTTAVGGGTLTYASGAVQTTTGGLTVGTSGNFGTMNVSSGSALTFGNVVSYVGYLNGIGVLNLNGGSFSVANDFRVGGSDSSGTDRTGYGTVTMSGGTVNLSSLTIARGNDYRNAVSGSVTISGGTMTSTNDVIVGYAGTGTGKLVLNGGTLKVATTATKWLQVGEWDSTSAQVDISNGNLDLNANTSMKFNSGNSSGTHTVNQYGGVVTFYSDFGTNVGGTGNVDLRYSSGSTGTNTYNLNGGTLTVPQITASQATGARVFNFNGGTLRAAVSSTSFMNLGSDASVNVRNGGAILDSNGKDITILSPLAHSAIAGDVATDGGLTKTGNGTLTLAGGYTYTGPTLVTGGTLGFNAGQTTPSWVGNTPGDLTVSNAALRISWSSGSAIPAANLTLIGSNGLSFDFGTLSLNPATVALSASGNLSASGTNVINIAGVGLVVGRFPLISAGNTISVSNFRLGSLPAGIAASLASSGNTLDLVITAAGQLLSWHGADASGNYLTNWDINLSANWYDVNYNLTRYLQYGGNAYGDNVMFGGAAQAALDGTNYVNVTTRLVPATLSFSAGVPYRLTGAGGIDGVTALVLTNMSNTVFLGTSNGYTGGTLVQSGTLEITGDNALGAVSGGLTMAGGTLQIDGSFTSGRMVSLAADTTLGVGAGANAQFTSEISGPGALNKTDSGILILKGTNTFSGQLLVHAGTVVLDSGSISNSQWNSIGAVGSDSGTLTLKGAASFFTTFDLNVADVQTTTGILNVQDTATVTANNLFVASANDANSTANGTVNQTGGTVTQTSTSSGTFVIGGRNSGSSLGVGTYNLAGGTVIATTGVRLGGYGTGTVNQSGGLFRTAIGGINLARYPGASGTYNLNGGTLETYNVASSTGSNAVFNFNGGTLLAAANPGNPFMSGLSQANVLAGGAIIDSSSNNLSITQGLLAGSAAGGLTKQGFGALTLLGADTYTGPTVINGGSLTVTPAHQAPGAVSLADGATYAITLPGGPMAVTNGALTLGAGTTTLSFGFGTNGNAAGPLLVCGTLTVNGTLNVAMGGIPSRFAVGSFPLVKYSGAIAGGGSLNPVIAAPHGMSVTLSNDAPSSTLYAVVSSLGAGIVWSGTNPDPARTNLWDLNSTTNWLVGTTPSDYAELVPPGDAVTFNDSGSGLVLLSNTASPASVTISNNSVNYTFQGSGQVNSTLGLIKLGAATATLNVPGSYSGSTVIAKGTLSLGTNQTFANLTGSGTVATASGAPTLTVNSSTDTTFSGTLQGGLGLTKTGNGTLTLTGTNNFTGNVFAKRGTVVLDSGVINGGTLWSSIGQDDSDNATLILKGTGTFTNNGDFNVSDIGSATGTVNISDNATLMVGPMYVASANAAGSTASGTVNQTSGTVQNTYLNIGGRSSTNGVGVYNLSGGTLIGTGTVRAGGVGTGTLNISGTASASFASTSASYVGYRTGTGALNMTGGSFSAAGELRVGGSDASGTQYYATGSVTVANATMSLGALTIARGNYLDNSCAGSVTLNGGSTLISTNDVIVQYAGTGLGKLAINGGTLVVGPAATKWLMVGWYDTGASELDITSGSILLENGTSLKLCRGGNTGGNVVNQTGGNVIFYSDAGLTVGGTGNLDLNLGGGSASVSTYNLDGGTLTVPQIIASSSSGSSLFNFNGGTLQAAASSTAFMQGLTAANVRAGGAVIDTATNNITIAQSLLNNGVDEDGGLTKTGNGTLWLNGVNTYTNLTRVVAGTLGGNGTIAGAVTVNSGAGLAPGAGLGTLTVNGNLTLSPGSTNTFEVNGTTGTNDVVVLGANVTYGGVLKIVPSGTFTLGQQFTLFSGAGAVNPGNFAQILGTPGDRLAFAFANGVLSVVAGNPAPVITAITPNVGRINGGTFVTITGSDFASGLTVQFGANLAPVVNYSNSTLITAVTPASAPGLVTVTVMNPDSHFATTNFTYVLPPPPATLSSAVKSGGNLVLTWTGGTNANCLLLSATNVTLPRSSWVPVATNVVLSDGRSTNTIPVTISEPKRFYLLSVPYN